jgi:hypothetical protein
LLNQHIDEPVKFGDRTLILRKWRSKNEGAKAAFSCFVQVA